MNQSKPHTSDFATNSMDKVTNQKTDSSKSVNKKNKDTYIASRILLFLLLLALLSSFFAIVHAGQRGVLMQFGQVQEEVLEEGIHLIIPLVNTVQKLSVRVQSEEISTEASSKDLQDVYTDVALNWHIIPEEANKIFQQIGDEQAIAIRIVNPAIEEVLKAVMAKYTAEEVITKRREVKAEVDRALTEKLINYHVAVDDISLLQLQFSERFSDAVEAKQVAEQEAKRAGFIALKATREAEAKVNLARGEAEVQKLISETLTPQFLKKQAVEKWDGKVPLIVGNENRSLLELELDDIMKSTSK